MESFATVNFAWSKEEPRRTLILRLYAFLGRYAHQQVNDLEKRTVRFLRDYADEVGTLIEEEAAATRTETDG